GQPQRHVHRDDGGGDRACPAWPAAVLADFPADDEPPAVDADDRGDDGGGHDGFCHALPLSGGVDEATVGGDEPQVPAVDTVGGGLAAVGGRIEAGVEDPQHLGGHCEVPGGTVGADTEGDRRGVFGGPVAEEAFPVGGVGGEEPEQGDETEFVVGGEGVERGLAAVVGADTGVRGQERLGVAGGAATVVPHPVDGAVDRVPEEPCVFRVDDLGHGCVPRSGHSLWHVLGPVHVPCC